MVRRTRDAEAELNLPPGFRFHPTDEELIVAYLCRKVAQQRLPVPIIAEVDLYKYDPWQLPGKLNPAALPLPAPALPPPPLPPRGQNSLFSGDLTKLSLSLL